MADESRWGPNQPHPLAKMRTELVWEGKYDEWGNRREVDVAGLAMPLERIETIDQRRSPANGTDALTPLETREKGQQRDDFRNRLIWGDNKLAMASLLAEFRGRIDLIYIDPPFDVGADFTMDVPIGDDTELAAKDQTALERVAYRDLWGNGADSYLPVMYERFVLLRELLSDRGSIYVHCDTRVNFLLRAMLDEIFGSGNFRNEIVWCYRGGGVPKRDFAAKHDTIFRYSKTGDYLFDVDAVRIPYSNDVLRSDPSRYDKSYRDNKVYEGYKPNDLGKHPDDWWTIQPLMPSDKTERVDYPTQKPVELIQRIIDASTVEESLVLDAYCGSGTTLAVAEGLRVRRTGEPSGKERLEYFLAPGRRWIGCDLGRFAIHTTRKRLIDLQRRLGEEGKPYRAFDVLHLGQHERQWWQSNRFSGGAHDHRRAVLESYGAEPLANSPARLLHGRKGAAFVHVAAIDALLAPQDVARVAAAAKEAGAGEIVCLAWEFEMNLPRACVLLESELDVRIRLVQIPREIMEKNRTRPPPFFEIATLEAQPVYGRSRLPGGTSSEKPAQRSGPLRQGGPTVDIKLTKFVPSLADVPTKELEALQARAFTSGFDFIDFWAVDFHWRPGEPLHHDWQDYRTRKDRSLATISNRQYVYSRSGSYTVCVKVIDVFGCETSITVAVEV